MKKKYIEKIKWEYLTVWTGWRKYVLVNFYLTEELLLPLTNSLLSLFLHFLLKLLNLFYPPTMFMFLVRFQAIHFSCNWFKEIIQKITAQNKRNLVSKWKRVWLKIWSKIRNIHCLLRRRWRSSSWSFFNSMTLLVFADISSDELTFSCIISNTWHMQHHRSLQKQTYKQSIFQCNLLIWVLCNMWIKTISWKPLGRRFSSFEKFTLQLSAPSLSYKQVIIYKSHLKGRPRSSMPFLQKRLILTLSKSSINQVIPKVTLHQTLPTSLKRITSKRPLTPR